MLSKLGHQNPTPLQSLSPPLLQSRTSGNMKNDLNCYCQKLGIPLPVYETRVEGSSHAPRFRSTVTVAHSTFTPSSFATRKTVAEQEAAKLALHHLLTQDLAYSTTLRVHLRQLVCQDKARCKSILNDFLAKIKMECSYETVQVKVIPSVFVCSLALNSTCFKGEPGKNKKEAEQLAALEAILSLLDDPTYAASISNVIKSKFNVSAPFNVPKDNPISGDCSVTGNVCSKTTTLNSLVHLTQKAILTDHSNFRGLGDEEIRTSVDSQANNTEEQGGSENLVNKNRQYLVNSLPQTEKESGHGVLGCKQGGSGLLTEAVDNASYSYVNLPLNLPSLLKPQHEMKLPEAAQSASQQISVPVEKQGGHRTLDGEKGGADFPAEAVTIPCVNLPITLPSLSELQPGIILPEVAQSDSQENSVSIPPAVLSPVYDLISSKKRERNKKKANKKKENKRLRAENR